VPSIDCDTTVGKLHAAAMRCAGIGPEYQSSAYASSLTPQGRADKIAHLREAVEKGDYCVSPEQIAESMVHEVLASLFTL
jgi:hypothetical protein